MTDLTAPQQAAVTRLREYLDRGGPLYPADVRVVVDLVADTPEPPKHYVVVAGSYEQFRAWAQDMGLNPRGPNLIYLRDDRAWPRLRGLDPMTTEVAWTGTYHTLPHLDDLKDMLRSAGLLAPEPVVATVAVDS